MTDTRADLVVAGGGPVGLGTAIAAALAGLDVVLLEPRPGPVDKACGEGLLPTALGQLARLGVDPPGCSFTGIAYVRGSVRAEARFRRGPGRGVRRTVLSERLARRADEVGVRRLARRAERVVQRPGAVEVAGVSGSWLAVADGLHSPLRRALGLSVPAPRPLRYGLRRHYACQPWSDSVEVHWARDAEAYVTPVADGVVGVALLCGGGGAYEGWLGRFPALRDLLAAAPALTRVRGAGPLRQHAAGRRAGRAFLVGDAAGYVDALTGEGIAVGLGCAQALVDCLVAGRPQDYERAWRRETRRYRTLTRALLWASARPALRSAIVPAAARLPRTYAAVVNALA